MTAAPTLGQRLSRSGRGARGALAFASVGALAAKLAYELSTGQALFVDAARLGFVPVPLAHAAGALAGMLAVLPPARRSRRDARGRGVAQAARFDATGIGL